MNPVYAISNIDELFSPSLIFFKDLIRQNIQTIVTMAGSPDRLRPHVKTHKCREIVQLQSQAGIHKQKAATLAEAEMLGQERVPDVLIAYPMVGPNRYRLVELIQRYPETRFSSLIDHPQSGKALSDVLAEKNQSHDVLIDLNVGMNRTGISIGEDAVSLYAWMQRMPGLNPVGFHVYDGHNHQDLATDRQKIVDGFLSAVLEMRAKLEKKGIAVPKMVCGGTPSFPIFAKLDFPGLECSPGTFVLHDQSYSKFADLAGLIPAAVLLTRVISRPTPNRVTLDLGHKAVAADPPAGKRCTLLDIPDCTHVMQSEEHLVIETPIAEQFTPGDIVFAIPSHICPTCAVHQRAYVIENGTMTGTWPIAARDRILTV